MAKYEQSMKDRRDDARGARDMDRRENMRGTRSGMMSGGFDIKDNSQAWVVKSINSNAEQYDTNRVKPYNDGGKGYPSEAWNYRF